MLRLGATGCSGFGAFSNWFVAVEILMIMFGVTTAPLLLSLAADAAVARVVVRDLIDIRAPLPVHEDGSS